MTPTFSNVTSDSELLTMTLILLDLKGELDPRIVASVACGSRYVIFYLYTSHF